MQKIVISLILEGDKATLLNLKDEVISNCAPYIVSVTANEIEEPKKGLKIPAFMVESNYRKILSE